jgi:hypothetical protein
MDFVDVDSAKFSAYAATDKPGPMQWVHAREARSLAAYEAQVADRATTSAVPVAWADPRPSDLARVGEGIDIVVIGTVRRRFFRVAGATQSRTEVVADAVIPARRRKQVDAVLRTAAEGLRPT